MVYAAQKVDTGKLYAVKCMDKRLIKARHATRMIMNERDVLASVNHPFVTGLQSAYHDDGGYSRCQRTRRCCTRECSSQRRHAPIARFAPHRPFLPHATNDVQ